MKLAELNPVLVGAGGEGIFKADGSPAPERHGVGLMFDCRCGCGERRYVSFENPVDGGAPMLNEGEPAWHRTGETVETLTLRPSIWFRSDDRPACGWHGFITNGEVKSC